MTTVMGDATHDNVHILVGLKPNIAAGYDTGTPDIRWTDSDWAQFPGIPHVHIDQAYGDTRAIEAHVLVFDVEKGAFSPDQAEALINANTSPRPTIYVNRSNMDATIASAQKSSKWKGDIWLSFPNWRQGQMLPVIPVGCRYVAIQNVLGGSADLSVVLDSSWPEGASTMDVIVIPGVPGKWLAVWYFVPGKIVIGQGTDGTPFVTKFANGAWSAPTPI